MTADSANKTHLASEPGYGGLPCFRKVAGYVNSANFSGVLVSAEFYTEKMLRASNLQLGHVPPVPQFPFRINR